MDDRKKEEQGRPGAETAAGPWWRSLAGIWPFLAIVVQFGLVVLLVQAWQLENPAVGRVLQLAFAGFIVHHFLPLRFRMPWFALLSIVGTMQVVSKTGGPGTIVGLINGSVSFSQVGELLFPGVTLVAIGLALIAICHLPIGFWWRVGILCAAGTVLAVLRANELWIPALSDIWMILGSMFVFRLMVYLYDMKHRTAPFSVARSLSYFFMLPNVCFPLFPLVDYKAFCSTYYNEDWVRVYQTGVRWMFRGIFHLLLYRLFYRLAPLDVADLSSLLDVATFMVTTYLLYLKISGEFHLIVGLLHMFGFNLPETHHLYLLSSSFTDFWRRINIYWKDFIMKLFFYPIFFRVKKLGTVRALSIATLATFFATWLLHSWQWFWLRGSFLHTWQDISFWTILALLVLVNALYESKPGRRRKLGKASFTVGEQVSLGLKTIGTFVTICVLWTVWSCASWDELRALMITASQPEWFEILVVAGVLVTIGACGVIWGRSHRDSAEGGRAQADRQPFNFWRSALAVSTGSVVLLAASSLDLHALPKVARVVALLRNDALNVRDMNLQHRGYYEELDAARLGMGQWRQAPKAPEGWLDGRKAFFRNRDDFLLNELAPQVSVEFSGAWVNINSLGMRDREYEPRKPEGTYRLVLAGASNEFGSGVEDHETFENLVEDRLNLESPDSQYSKYEILNLSVAGDSLLHKLMRIERMGFDFQPDAILMCVFEAEWKAIHRHLSNARRQGIQAQEEYGEFLSDVFARAGIDDRTPDSVMRQRIRRFMPEIYQWTIDRFARLCEERGVRPIMVYRPATIDPEGREALGRRTMQRLAGEAGIPFIDLTPAFDEVTDRKTLIIAPWDDHANALGHRLLAGVLYQHLKPMITGHKVAQASVDER